MDCEEQQDKSFQYFDGLAEERDWAVWEPQVTRFANPGDRYDIGLFPDGCKVSKYIDRLYSFVRYCRPWMFHVGAVKLL